MDVGTGIAYGTGSIATAATILGIAKMLIGKNGVAKSKNGYQTNKDVNGTITDRLGQMREQYCIPQHNHINEEIKETKKDIDKLETRTEKAIQASQKAIQINICTEIGYLKESIDLLRKEIEKNQQIKG